jgi:hypothetical protein
MAGRSCLPSEFSRLIFGSPTWRRPRAALYLFQER